MSPPRPDTPSPADRPLAGRTVVVTRPREQATLFVGSLEALGADVLLAPTIRIEPRPLDERVSAVLRDLTDLPARRLHERQRGTRLRRLPGARHGGRRYARRAGSGRRGTGDGRSTGAPRSRLSSRPRRVRGRGAGGVAGGDGRGRRRRPRPHPVRQRRPRGAPRGAARAGRRGRRASHLRHRGRRGARRPGGARWRRPTTSPSRRPARRSDWRRCSRRRAPEGRSPSGSPAPGCAPSAPSPAGRFGTWPLRERRGTGLHGRGPRGGHRRGCASRMSAITVYGVCAVSFMMVMYALEPQGPRLHPGVRRGLPALERVRVPLRSLAVRCGGSDLGCGGRAALLQRTATTARTSAPLRVGAPVPTVAPRRASS